MTPGEIFWSTGLEKYDFQEIWVFPVTGIEKEKKKKKRIRGWSPDSFAQFLPRSDPEVSVSQYKVYLLNHYS